VFDLEHDGQESLLAFPRWCNVFLNICRSRALRIGNL